MYLLEGKEFYFTFALRENKDISREHFVKLAQVLVSPWALCIFYVARERRRVLKMNLYL